MPLWFNSVPLLLLRVLIFSMLIASSLTELVTHGRSLTLFDKVQEFLVIVFVPFLVWEAGTKLLKGTSK